MWYKLFTTVLAEAMPARALTVNRNCSVVSLMYLWRALDTWLSHKGSTIINKSTNLFDWGSLYWGQTGQQVRVQLERLLIRVNLPHFQSLFSYRNMNVKNKCLQCKLKELIMDASSDFSQFLTVLTLCPVLQYCFEENLTHCSVSCHGYRIDSDA